MDLQAISPAAAPEATGGYVNALQVESASRLLFISGQIPQTRQGQVPDRAYAATNTAIATRC